MTILELADKAEREGLWLKYLGSNLWFSPREVREKVRRGCFDNGDYSKTHWLLRSPVKERVRLENRVIEAESDLQTFNEHVKREREKGAQ